MSPTCDIIEKHIAVSKLIQITAPSENIYDTKFDDKNLMAHETMKNRN